jgi:hypothetical protein
MRDFAGIARARAFALALSCVLALCLSSGEAGAVPVKIPYVAQVLQANGAPFAPAGGTVNVGAALYLVQSGGFPVWGPVNYVGVPVHGGTFSIVLDGEQTVGQLGGQPAPLDLIVATASELWLALSINGQPMEPRQRMLAVPYALAAADALAVGGVPAGELATLADLASHTHDASAVVSGVLAPARVPPGTDSTKLPLAGGGMQGSINLNLHALQNLRFQVAATAPVACSPATIGFAYFNTQTKTLDICDGQAVLSLGAVAPNVPDAFSFAPLEGQPLSTLVSSQTVTITGLTAPAAVTISGQGNPEFRVAGGGWGTTGAIAAGQTLQLRMTTAAQPDTFHTATVTVAGVSASWQTRTQAVQPCALPWGGSLAHGQSVTAFASASPTCAFNSCSQQTRTCNNGALSGSFTVQSCAPKTGCTVTGLVMGAGFYGSDSASASTTVSFNSSVSSWSTVKACETGCSCGGSSTNFQFSANGSCLSAQVIRRSFTFSTLPTSATISQSGTGVHNYNPSFVLLWSDGSEGGSPANCSPSDFQYTSWSFTQGCTFTYP